MGPYFRVSLDRLLLGVTAGGQTFVNVRIDFCGEVSSAHSISFLPATRTVDCCRSGDCAGHAKRWVWMATRSTTSCTTCLWRTSRSCGTASASGKRHTCGREQAGRVASDVCEQTFVGCETDLRSDVRPGGQCLGIYKTDFCSRETPHQSPSRVS